jgi:hypothetical protein
VASYISKAFGDRLGDARAAMEALAALLPPEELNRVGFRPYERFCPDVPDGAQGWGAKGEFKLERIADGRSGETDNETRWAVASTPAPPRAQTEK